MNENVKWKGNDLSLTESLDEYGYVYKYDGTDFFGYSVHGIDESGKFTTFAPFYMDNETIDEYFADNGEKIASMCGVTPDEMDYEWKMDALLSYYGALEFQPSMYNTKTRDELYQEVQENWFGSKL